MGTKDYRIIFLEKSLLGQNLIMNLNHLEILHMIFYTGNVKFNSYQLGSFYSCLFFAFSHF